MVQNSDRQFDGRAVEAGPFGQIGPAAQGQPGECRCVAATEFSLAPVAHHFRKWNAHGTNGFAAAAECRGIGQMTGRIDADQGGGEDRAHGTGIDPAIGMAANGLVNRTVVHTGAASDTAEHFLKFATQHFRTTVIEKDHVKGLGTV